MNRNNNPKFFLKNNPFNIPEDNMNSNVEFRKTH